MNNENISSSSSFFFKKWIKKIYDFCRVFFFGRGFCWVLIYCKFKFSIILVCNINWIKISMYLKLLKWDKLKQLKINLKVILILLYQNHTLRQYTQL